MKSRNKLVQANILRYSLNTLKLHKSNIRKYTFNNDGSVYLYRYLNKAEDGQSYVKIESYLQSTVYIRIFMLWFSWWQNIKQLVFFIQKFCVKILKNQTIWSSDSISYIPKLLNQRCASKTHHVGIEVFFCYRGSQKGLGRCRSLLRCLCAEG